MAPVKKRKAERDSKILPFSGQEIDVKPHHAVVEYIRKPDDGADGGTDVPSESDTEYQEDEDIHKLLEPFSNDQLISLLVSAAARDSTTLAEISTLADLDPAHRKLFVHGLDFTTTSDGLRSVFTRYGDIVECHVVVDRSTGRSKGYGFVLFRHRSSARRALRKPQKLVDNRMASCQLASIGPTANPNPNPNPNPNSSNSQHHDHNPGDNLHRKIYVGNVHPDIDAVRLRAFFSQYGDVEEGPIGWDRHTGKSRGFALFVYKTSEGARKALEEPTKNFEGHNLVCQKATTDFNKARTSSSVSNAAVGSAAPPPNIPGNIGSLNGSAYGGQIAQSDMVLAQQAAMLGQGLLGHSMPANAAVLAMMAAAGQNSAAFGINPAMFASLNPVLAGALAAGAAPSALPQAATATTQHQGTDPMQGYTMGRYGYPNVGFQGPPPGFQGAPGYQINQPQVGAHQGDNTGKASMQRHSFGPVNGYGLH